MMKGDFKETVEFHDQVIRMDPDWSAFATTEPILHIAFERAMATSNVRSMICMLRCLNLK